MKSILTILILSLVLGCSISRYYAVYVEHLDSRLEGDRFIDSLQNAGVTWSNQKVTKKGRMINFQFYLPIYGRHFLDELRTMNIKMGISI